MISFKVFLGKIKSKYKKFTNDRIRMKSNTICTIPWVHLNIIPRGKVYHCCMTTDYKSFAGDLTTQTIEEVWNGDHLKNIRKQMINGQEPSACSKCFEAEQSSGISTRIHHNKYFSKKLAEIPVITAPDGHVEDIDLRYWDFRFSNLCNYKCRTCGPEFSSAWIPDAEKLGWGGADNKKVLGINLVDEKTNVTFLQKYVDRVEKIYFAGGEPLLMDEHWQILDMLDQAGRYDVVLTYNSNLSKLTYGGKNAIDYWKKWGKRVWLWPSIDEIDDRAELIRSGTVWKNVEANLIAISKIGVHVKPSITVSCMNVQRIPEILDRLIDIGVIKQEEENWRNFSINIVEYSPRFHVSALSDETRKQVKDRLEKYIADFKVRFDVDVRDIFLHLFWHLDKPFNKENALSFKDATLRLDMIRNEETLKTIPEIKELFI